MNLFNKILKDNESLFLNEIFLDHSFTPPKIEHRESENEFIATCIKPLFQKRTGKNLFIYGQPGIGKTLATRLVLKELKEKSDITPIYINCWENNTTHKIAIETCHILNYKFTHNKTTSQLIEKIISILNKNPSVIVLDECDKIKTTEDSILYPLLEKIYKKSIILITNELFFLSSLDQRIKSRLIPSQLEFKSYSLQETENILKNRIKYAFQQNILDEDSFNLILQKTFSLKDIRTGLFLLKEAAEIAESKAKRQISIEDAQQAIEKLKEFKIKNSLNLEQTEKEILELIKQNPEKTTKELFEAYTNQTSYATFSRKIENLQKNKQISKSKKQGKNVFSYGTLNQ